MKPDKKRILFLFLLIFVAIIGVLHAVTPGHMILYHDTYRRLSYFPITLGAILYGFWGGVSLATLSCLAFVPHLFMFWASGPQAYYSELSEILFYFAAGAVIGLICSRENRLREKYKTLSEKLTRSYKRLHDQAFELLEAEKLLGQSQKLSVLGHVSASLAHEIKNPLASIKGAAEILADEVPQDHPKHEFIEIMRDEISRLNHSVEEVLTFCRGQQNRDSGQQESIDKIVSRVVGLLDTGFKEKAIQVSVLKEPDTQLFFTEKAAMIQILMNILLNAIDAVKKNGRVHIKFGRREKGCFIRISDDGPGIEPNLKKEVFQSFVTFKKEGTGLGLSISKKIIERLGGNIKIEKSRLGGAAFLIVLPDKKISDDGSVQHV